MPYLDIKTGQYPIYKADFQVICSRAESVDRFVEYQIQVPSEDINFTEQRLTWNAPQQEETGWVQTYSLEDYDSANELDSPEELEAMGMAIEHIQQVYPNYNRELGA